MSESFVNRLRTVCAAFAAVSIIAAGSAFARAAKPGQNIPPPAFSHVFIVIFENHPYSEVVGATDMPYLNSLIASYGLAANYYATGHPSIDNYFMLTTGKPITHDDNFKGVVKAKNVVDAMKANNLAWKAYFEDLPADPYTDNFQGAGPYIRHHNPFSYFANVRNDPTEAANMVDLSQLYTDLSSGSLPNYSFIVPNGYHQGHDPDTSGGLCANSDRMAEVDCFLSTDISPVVDYVANQGGLLIITWDEGDGADHKHGGGHIATVLVSNLSKPGYQSTRLYQHQSSLRLMLQSLGVTKFPGAAQRAPEMGEFFNQ